MKIVITQILLILFAFSCSIFAQSSSNLSYVDHFECDKLVYYQPISGSGFVKILWDDGSKVPMGASETNTQGYRKTGFIGGNGSEIRPVAYVSGSKPVIAAQFSIKCISDTDYTDFYMRGRITINGIKHLLLEPQKIVKQNGFNPKYYYLKKEVVYNFPINTVQAYENFTIEWEISDSEITPNDEWDHVFSSTSPLYFTYKAPKTIADSDERFFHSLIHIGCKRSSGNNNDIQILNAIWNYVKDREVMSVDSGKDIGELLTYYKRYECESQTTESLLKTSDGQCGAWAKLLIDLYKTQGVSYDTESADYITVFHENWPPDNVTPDTPISEYNHEWKFFVKNWVNTQTLPLQNAPPIPNHTLLIVPEQTWNTTTGERVSYRLHDGSKYVANYTEYEDDKGNTGQSNIPGQSNHNPASVFNNHQFCAINNVYLDPSYGVVHELENFKDNVISGWGYESNYMISEGYYGKDLNGNGFIDSGMVMITGLFVDPDNLSKFNINISIGNY